LLTRRPLDGIGLGAAGLLLVAAYAGLLGWAMSTLTYSVWGGLIVVPWVIAFNGLLIWRAVVRRGERWFAWALSLGYAAKLVGIALRYFFAYVFYGGASDAERYNQYAAARYRLWRQGAITWEGTDAQGTQAMEIITTAVYTITGPTPLGGFVVFGSLAFWGVYFIFRAFETAVPLGDHRRYAYLLFLLPSLLYWPSSIGKEAWILFFVGLTAWGAARFFAGAGMTGLALLGVGAVGTSVVRPHITVLLMAGVFVAQLFRPTSKAATSAITKVLGILVMGAAVAVLATQSAEFLGIDDLSGQALTDQFEFRSENTEQGGSAFEPVPLNSPFGVPAAILTLLFRPLPWEAGSLQLLVQSMEGLFLLGRTIVSWPRLQQLPALMRRSPYLVFAVVYMLGFIIAFSQFGNFGILARQRVLMLPFFLALLALPVLRGRRFHEDEKGLVDAVTR